MNGRPERQFRYHARWMESGSRLADRLRDALVWLAVLIGSAFALRPLDASDTWWHLAAGRWIAEHRTIPATDVLSFTVPDSAWINLQWLYDVLLYGTFRMAGPDGVVLVGVLLCTATLALLAMQVRRWLGPVASALLIAWVTLIAQERFWARPEVLSFLLLQLVLLLVGSARRGRGRRVWWLVPLMVLWVNTHALFVLGVLVIACAVIPLWLVEVIPLPRLWRESTSLGRAERKRLTLAGTLAVAATLINPFLLRGVMFPLELLTRFGEGTGFGSIGEFAGPFSRPFGSVPLAAYQIGFVVAVTFVLAAALRTAFARNGQDGAARFDLSGAVLFVCLGYLSLRGARNTALFAIGSAPFVAQCIRTCVGALRPRRRFVAQAAAVGTALLLVGLLWAVASNEYYRWTETPRECGSGVFEVAFPVRAVEFVEAQRLPDRVFNDDYIGGYLAWARPGRPVFVDGRLEVYDRFFEEYVDGLARPESWARLADRFDVNTVVLGHRWSNRHRLIRWLRESPHWQIVYYDESGVVFLRAQGHAETIRRARASFVTDWEPALRARLRAAPPGGRFPVGHVLAVTGFANLLNTLGDPAGAAEYYERALGFDLLEPRRLFLHLWLAEHYLERGEIERARRHLDRAEALRPADSRVLELRRRLGRGPSANGRANLATSPSGGPTWARAG